MLLWKMLLSTRTKAAAELKKKVQKNNEQLRHFLAGVFRSNLEAHIGIDPLTVQ